jgi:hypothetical protein
MEIYEKSWEIFITQLHVGWEVFLNKERPTVYLFICLFIWVHFCKGLLPVLPGFDQM